MNTGFKESKLRLTALQIDKDVIQTVFLCETQEAHLAMIRFYISLIKC